MAKITSKYQVTIPKRIAEQKGMRPGDEITWHETGDAILIAPAAATRQPVSVAERLERFDQATKRQAGRERTSRRRPGAKDRGWTREELYRRGSTR